MRNLLTQPSTNGGNFTFDVTSAYKRCSPLMKSDLDWLIDQQKIPKSALEFDYPKIPVSPIKQASVSFSNAQRFDFNWEREDGYSASRALIIPCRDEAGDLADLAAWDPLTQQIALWVGRVAMLGQQNVLAPRLSMALKVQLSPMDWLRDEREGIYIIDNSHAAPLLNDAGRLAAETTEQGLALERNLTMRPKIVVRAPPNYRGGA